MLVLEVAWKIDRLSIEASIEKIENWKNNMKPFYPKTITYRYVDFLSTYEVHTS